MKLISDLRLATKIGEKGVKLRSYSQFMVQKFKGEAQTKESLMKLYVILAREKFAKFKTLEISHIPREHNTQENVISVQNMKTTPPQLDNIQRLSSMIDELPYSFTFESKHEPKIPCVLHESHLVEFLRELISQTYL